MEKYNFKQTIKRTISSKRDILIRSVEMTLLSAKFVISSILVEIIHVYPRNTGNPAHSRGQEVTVIPVVSWHWQSHKFEASSRAVRARHELRERYVNAKLQFVTNICKVAEASRYHSS